MVLHSAYLSGGMAYVARVAGFLNSQVQVMHQSIEAVVDKVTCVVVNRSS